MSARVAPFNLYLAGVVALVLAVSVGCGSPEKRRKDRVHYTELSIYEGVPASVLDTNRMMAVMVANAPVLVKKMPILTEVDLEEAEVVDSPGGGYAMRLRFNDHGRYELIAFTGSHRGQHLVIFVRYGIRKKQDKVPLKEAWLAAPVINRQISDGTLTFTPDAGKEELYSILDGLRNAIEVNQRPWVF